MRLPALLLALALAVVPADAVRADVDDAVPAPEDYEEALTPYGGWTDAPDYGRVWLPSVAVGWQPYVYGSWAWTPAGWTWVSSEPWGWTFHYGRWALVPGLGWCWVPGYVYAPAWVDWYWGDGFVGWAPLPPFGTHVAVINHFVFVHERDFCSPRVRHVIVRHDRLPRGIGRGWRGRASRPPEIHHIERVGRFPVVHVSDRGRHTLAPRRDRERRQDHVSIRPEPANRHDGWLRPGDRHDRRRSVVEIPDHQPPAVERPDHRPPVVTSAPIPRNAGRPHLVRPSRDDVIRPGAARRPDVLGGRAPDAIAPRPGFAFDGHHGERAPDMPPPIVRGGVTVNPRAGRLAPGGPSHGGGDRGSQPRHGGQGHVVPGAR